MLGTLCGEAAYMHKKDLRDIHPQQTVSATTAAISNQHGPQEPW
jgi:hypothetical protein